MSRVKRRIRLRPKTRGAQEKITILESLRRLAIPAALFMSAGVVILVFCLWQSGWFKQQLANGSMQAFKIVTKRAGFAVKNIVVDGRNADEKNAVLRALDINQGEAILGIDPKEELDRLSAISWVKDGTVERRLPSTIYVRLNSRIPIALWQNKGKFYLIDPEGHVVREATMDESPGLPRVVGAGAEKDAANFLSQLAAQPGIFGKTHAAVRIGGRRWDLHMQNNVVVKLPEEGVEETLARLAKLIDEQHILDRDVIAVDLRLPDRMAVETSQPVNPPKPKTPPPKI